MASTPLCVEPLQELKKSLRDEFPGVKSSHLSEALAFSMGFRTYAAMQAAMTGLELDRPFYLLSTDGMRKRLMELGYPDDPEFDFETTIVSLASHGLVSTEDSSAYDIDYKSTRDQAWRNLMVSAVNAALEQRLFTLRPGDNRYTGREQLFDFTLPNGLPVRGVVSDAGWDEVAIHAAVNPKGQHISAMAGFDCGDVVGMAWVERRRGVWMQSATKPFYCRKHLIKSLAAIQVQPFGYGDRGRVIM
jgi:hypothetical protein